MMQLLAAMIPTSTSMNQRQISTSQRKEPPAFTTAVDLADRNILGLEAGVPNIPISTPLQQAISGYQDIMQPLLNRAFGSGATESLAQRMGPGGSGGGGIPAAPGVPQFGRTQTREELGIPERREYFPLTPTAEEIEDYGLVPPVRRSAGAKKRAERIKGIEEHKGRLEKRIEKRTAAGKGTGVAERKLAGVEKRLARASR